MPPNLLEMMVAAVEVPEGLAVAQDREVFVSDSGRVPEHRVIKEKLLYRPPFMMRSDILSRVQSGFFVETEHEFIQVIQGRVKAGSKGMLDMYTDVLLCRDAVALEKKLSARGIDIGTVTLQLYDDKACFKIGRSLEKNGVLSGFWVEKERLFPVRYVVQIRGWTVDCRYEDWQKTGEVWYPEKTTVFLDGNEAVRIWVTRFEVKPDIALSLFDVDAVQSKYSFPSNDAGIRPDSSGMQGLPDMDELFKQIDAFKDLYE